MTHDALGLSYQPRQGWFYTYTDARDDGEYQVGPFPSRDAARDAALRDDESVAAHALRDAIALLEPPITLDPTPGA